MSWLLALLVGAAAADARADRAPSPTDLLGDWAIETSLSLGGQSERRIVAVAGGMDSVDLGRSRFGLSVRVWPIQGGYVRLEEALDALGEKSLAEVDAPERSLTDLRIGTGYRARPFRSLVVGGGLDLEVPTGTGASTYNRVDFRAELMVGFSFTPRWDFYFRPLYGARNGEAGDPQRGQRVGWSAGFAYQLERFYMVGQGFNLHNFEQRDYLSAGGGLSFGFELRPGLSIAIAFDGMGSESISLQPSHREEVFAVGFHLTHVLYLTGRENEFRRFDQHRGEGWQWWSPRY